MVDNAAVLLRCGQGGGLDPWLPSVAFFIIGGTQGGDSKGAGDHVVIQKFTTGSFLATGS